MEDIIDIRDLLGFVNFEMIEPDIFNSFKCDGLRHELKRRRLPIDRNENELCTRFREGLD